MKNGAYRLLSLLVLTASLGAALTACVPVLMGGAVVGTALVASDRRTSGTQLEDEGIELRSANRIRDSLGERVHVNITSYNRRVLLTGEVPTVQDQQLVEQIVSQVDNVQTVVNEVAVLAKSTLGQRSSDVLVASRIKAGFVDARDLSANAFNIEVARGVAYLLGRVTAREADRATEIARTTNGVLKVVRVFDLITDEELRRLQPAPPATNAQSKP